MDKRKECIWKKIIGMTVIFSGVYFFIKSIAQKRMEGEEINAGNPYLSDLKKSLAVPTVYEKTVKPVIDQLLSFIALLLLAPLFATISIAIFVDDPGPVFFTQKRVGKDKAFFNLHKFRSMKMSTPHDVPTHQLSNPEQYITRIGKMLRKTSLDELPQIWDIFRGKMSIIGPRPALWNQKDLVEEREKYAANGVLPGLTGWAQINGRDELEISEKAELDGEYVKYLRQGGVRALFFDVKCFLGTIKSVVGGDGVVEGGTGELYESKKNPKIVNEEILVSVIVPAYNAASYLDECIQSVQRQFYSNWEMIIVDDCSKDNTYRIAEQYAEKDKRIKVIQHKENQGVAAARNTALKAATGDYVAFLDSDDFWKKSKLDRQLAFMENNIYDITYTAYQKINAVTGEKGKVIKVPETMTYEKIFGNTAMACLTVMINRKAVGDFCMPLLDHTEDQCTWQDILSRGYVAYGLNESLAYYREGNLSLTKDKKKSVEQQWNVYRVHYGFGLFKSAIYFSKYAVNAVIKHM